MRREIAIPEDSLWFQGHFPGDPLLPGIAQLHLVVETIQSALGEKRCLTALKRVRFKRVIRPEETMAIAVEPLPNAPDTFRFQLTVAGENACSGLMTTGPSEAVEDQIKP